MKDSQLEKLKGKDEHKYIKANNERFSTFVGEDAATL